MADQLSLVAFTLWLYFALAACVMITEQNCKPIGTKSITISWTSTPVNDTTTYYVYFCKYGTGSCRNTSINFHLGCIVNATRGKLEYSCDIGKAVDLKFPNEYIFYYYIKTDHGMSAKDIYRCPVSMEIQCPKPTRLRLIPENKSSLKLSWSPLIDMGENGPLLCYFITYFMADSPQDKFNDTYSDLGKYEFTIKSLLPYKTYHVYLQCALSCSHKKGVAAGPVIATTLEEKPQDLVIFEDIFSTNVDLKTRNVTVVVKIPEKDKWNGNIKEIRVLCYKYGQLCKNITLTDILAIDGQLQHNYKVIFPFLKTDAIYQIKAYYCNSVGCSLPSRNHTIPQAQPKKILQKSSESPKENYIVHIIVGSLLAVISLILIVVLILYCRRRQRRPVNRLDEVVGPLSPAVDTDSDGGAEGQDSEYARLDQQTNRTTLNLETRDFQSASVRSLNSLSSIDGLDRVIIRDGQKGEEL